MPASFKNTVAIVTGAASGIGCALAAGSLRVKARM